MLFPDDVLKQAEQDIANFQSKGQWHSGKKGCFHHYECPNAQAEIRPTSLEKYWELWPGQEEQGQGLLLRFICCFTSRSTARVILRRVVYRWRKLLLLLSIATSQGAAVL